MRIKYDTGGQDRALEALIEVTNHFCGPEETDFPEPDRLQYALRRLSEFIAYVDVIVENRHDEYYERLLSAIEKAVDVLGDGLDG